jgi:hypothetical protein
MHCCIWHLPYWKQWRADGGGLGGSNLPEIPNYRCLQNPWLGGHCPQILFLSVLSSAEFVEQPTNKILSQTYVPVRQCPTVLKYTVMVFCLCCLSWTAPRWFCCAYCWWLSAVLTQFLLNVFSSMTRNYETNNILVFADKTTNQNCPMLGDQQAIDLSHSL